MSIFLTYGHLFESQHYKHSWYIAQVEFQIFSSKKDAIYTYLWNIVRVSKSWKLKNIHFCFHRNNNFRLFHHHVLIVSNNRIQSFQDWCQFASICLQEFSGHHQICLVSRCSPKSFSSTLKPMVQQRKINNSFF